MSNDKNSPLGVSRRGFVGGVTGALGLLTLNPGRAVPQGLSQAPAVKAAPDEYDLLAKLANNENPYGPPESVMKAMTGAMKYANRYGYPDGGIVSEIASHHGVAPDNVLLGAGSGEILDVVCTTLLQGDRKIVSAGVSYASCSSTSPRSRPTRSRCRCCRTSGRTFPV